MNQLETHLCQLKNFDKETDFYLFPIPFLSIYDPSYLQAPCLDLIWVKKKNGNFLIWFHAIWIQYSKYSLMFKMLIKRKIKSSSDN